MFHLSGSTETVCLCFEFLLLLLYACALHFAYSMIIAKSIAYCHWHRWKEGKKKRNQNWNTWCVYCLCISNGSLIWISFVHFRLAHFCILGKVFSLRLSPKVSLLKENKENENKMAKIRHFRKRSRNKKKNSHWNVLLRIFSMANKSALDSGI